MFPLGLPGLSLPFLWTLRTVSSVLVSQDAFGWEKTPNFDPTKVSVNCPR